MYCINKKSASSLSKFCKSVRLLSAQPHHKATIIDGAEEYSKAQPFEKMPGPSSYSLIRNFLPGGKYHNKTVKEFARHFRTEYGDIHLLPSMFGRPSTLFTYNPDDSEKVFRTEGIWPNRRPMESLLHFRQHVKEDFYKGAGGLMTTTDEEWGKFRSAVNPILMNPANVKLYLPKVESVGSEFIERIREIRDPETLEVPDTFLNEIQKWTFESVVAVALDKELGLIRNTGNNTEAEPFFKDLNRLFQLMFALDFQPPFWKIIRTPTYYEMIKICKKIHDLTETYVNEAKLKIDESNGNKSESDKSVLEKLIKVDPRIATVMSMDMMLAGVDTTSTVFSGIMLVIAKNPEKQEILRKEILGTLPQKDSPLTVENMKNLPYLRACIKEGLRMHPLGAGLMRRTGQDLVLSGYQVPKGTDVAMLTEDALVDDENFSEGSKFIPERWIRGNVYPEGSCPATKASHPFIYLPFGFGPRSCVGKRVVYLELEIAIAKIIRNYYVEFNHPTENAFVAHFFNTPNIPLKFKFSDVEY